LLKKPESQAMQFAEPVADAAYPAEHAEQRLRPL